MTTTTKNTMTNIRPSLSSATVTWRPSKPRQKWTRTRQVWEHGCQIFLGTIYQNWGKLYQITSKLPNDHYHCKMVIEYTNLFHFQPLQNLPKLGFLVLKYTIWQPCWRDETQSWCFKKYHPNPGGIRSHSPSPRWQAETVFTKQYFWLGDRFCLLSVFTTLAMPLVNVELDPD
jgi:hypothetical protein